MSACPSLAGGGAGSLAEALRSIDCQTGEATALAFGRLFGADGRLLPALTLLLTLYVAFFAIALLTGRARIGVATLTPRMLTLGLVLTFATSWAAYQNVVWTLAAGAPDQVAGILTGTPGSATVGFADRLDRLFTLVSDAADQASRPAAATATGITPATPMVGGFTAATVLSVASAMLLLGTVGVLVTAKIALAAMLALGPLFITLALFGPTRGLFEGWLKAIVVFAITPLLAVLIGGGAVLALEPVARGIAMEGSQPSIRAVGVLFLGATVYLALMAMALRTATVLVTGWRLPGRDGPRDRATTAERAAMSSPSPPINVLPYESATGARSSDKRVRAMVVSLGPAPEGSALRDATALIRPSAQIVTLGDRATQPARRDARVHGVGSRFRSSPIPLRHGRSK